ncbi:MAG: hypothetical protein ACK55Z_36600, partial [bacterium]
IRDGLIKSIDDGDILVGDIIMIEVGEIFSVDGILIETNDLLIDESDITGESDPIEKNPESLIISGTKVIQGSGLLIN